MVVEKEINIKDNCGDLLRSEYSWMFNILLENSSEMISIWNKNARLILFTSIHGNYFGKEMPQYLKDILSFVHPEDYHAMLNEIEELLFRLKGFKAVYHFTSSTKKSKYLSSEFKAVIDDDGHLKYFVVISRDISDSKSKITGQKKEVKEKVYQGLAKEQSVNSYKTYSKGMGEQIFEQFTLEKDLINAFERQELEIYYQPIVSVSSYNVIGLEALLRWNHPIRGNISPIEFIPIAEESGLMDSISDWVLKKASLDVVHLNGKFGIDLFVTVNISAPQLHRNRFLRTILNILEEIPIKVENLKLEITESLLMKDTENTIEILRDLQNMGIQVYIDDFGTGYSSLSYLKLFPIAGLKIDKSFITNSLILEKDKAIVRAIINLAQILELKVTAEGVETQEQLNVLETFQCDYIQGYLFSKPLELKALYKFLQKHLRSE
ncbi:EAL domain-containing protein [Paenibacillus sp. LjRoot153]|uniref:sensor domain-containing protein n=1 Tax=Paenibacillus sp. LjRoot153 TaxID=3342270 RepID=UPI003ECFEFA9